MLTGSDRASRRVETADERVLILVSDAGPPAERCDRKSCQPAFFDHDADRIEWIVAFSDGSQSRLARGCADTLSWRLRIEARTAADGDKRRVRAENEPIAARQHGRGLETDPRKGRLTGNDGRSIGHNDTSEQLARAVMKPYAGTVTQ